VDVGQIDGAGLTDSAVLALCPRIRLVRDPDYDARFPAERWARAMVRLEDGGVLESGPRTALGDPDHPMGETELEAKYFALTQPVWGNAKAGHVKATIEMLGRSDAGLTQLLRAIRQ
jgi:2-methylcitrate dehydratase PrpD